MKQDRASVKLKSVGTPSASAESLGIPTALLSPCGDPVLFPGFCDVHVHFREPGFSYKETVSSGSRAAARGGYTAVCAMPNLNPVPDSLPHLAEELDRISRGACVRVLPYGSITVGEKGEVLSDMEAMAPYVVAFSDDGRGVQDEDLMRSAMIEARRLGKMIVAHCEVNALLHGGYIHAGAYAAAHGHPGISSASEYEEVRRDLRLAGETGCSFHVCHVSAKESVEAIREAKRAGIDVSCETAPHYLVLDENDLIEDGRFKMNPPLRSRADREALLEGVADGTIDMIATDHAPHAAEEKAKGLAGSAFGIVGLETAFPVLYTRLIRTGFLTNPRERFDIPAEGSVTLWDLDRAETIDPEAFLSMGKATPFAGERVYGACVATLYRNQIVYRREL